jgi:hypothetical protein
MTYVNALNQIVGANKDIPAPTSYWQAIADRNNRDAWVREIIFRECPDVSAAFLSCLLVEARHIRNNVR